jgi:hypothetical protein
MTCQVLPSLCRSTTLTLVRSDVDSDTTVSSVLGSRTTTDRSKNESAACVPAAVRMLSPAAMKAPFESGEYARPV